MAQTANGNVVKVVPNKSAEDERQYRLIVLPNQLEVLLVQDDQADRVRSHQRQPFLLIQNASYDLNMMLERFFVHVLCCDVRCADILLSSTDAVPTSCHALCCLQAAAAMDVNVGHFSDPDEVPGLAHFLGNAIASA